MICYHEHTDTHISDAEAFRLPVDGGTDFIQCPAGWFAGKDDAELFGHGLVKVVTVGVRADDRYFNVTEQTVGAVCTIINTPKPDEMIAAMHAAECAIKVNAVKALRETAVNRVNGIAAREDRAGNPTILAIGDAVVVALIAMTKSLPTDPALIDGEVMQRYAAIVGPLEASAPELLSAFAGMDL